MDEKRWYAESRDAVSMVCKLRWLNLPSSKSGRRKLRLYATGSCRTAWDQLTDHNLRTAIEVAERFADGAAKRHELTLSYERLVSLDSDNRYRPSDTRRRSKQLVAAMRATATCHPQAWDAAFAQTAIHGITVVGGRGTKEYKLLCDLLRCVFGNPFRKPAFNKKWRTETVTALATGIYEERAFDRLPILADALEEAGCDDPAMLAHLRGDGPHCRGCWVLDLAMGK